MMFHRFIILGIVLTFSGMLQAEALPNSAFSRVRTEIAQGADDLAGQVDPAKPIRIEIANAGETDVLFSLTQPVSSQRRLPAGGEIAFGSTNASYLPPPVYLFAYPEEIEIGINIYVLSTTNNIVRVVVGGQISDIPGGRTLSIESDGSVYVF